MFPHSRFFLLFFTKLFASSSRCNFCFVGTNQKTRPDKQNGQSGRIENYFKREKIGLVKAFFEEKSTKKELQLSCFLLKLDIFLLLLIHFGHKKSPKKAASNPSFWANFNVRKPRIVPAIRIEFWGKYKRYIYNLKLPCWKIVKIVGITSLKWDNLSTNPVFRIRKNGLIWRNCTWIMVQKIVLLSFFYLKVFSIVPLGRIC